MKLLDYHSVATIMQQIRFFSVRVSLQRFSGFLTGGRGSLSVPENRPHTEIGCWPLCANFVRVKPLSQPLRLSDLTSR